MLHFTQYMTKSGLPLSAVSLSRYITCQDVCNEQKQAGLPFSDLSDLKQTMIAQQEPVIIQF